MAFNLKNLKLMMNQIAEEKGLSWQQVKEAFEAAMASAYKKEYGHKGEMVRTVFNDNTGEVKFFDVKTVVEPSMLRAEEDKEEGEEELEKKIVFRPERHILLKDARKINSTINVNEELITELPHHEDFGRIAAQTAKQNIFQKLKEAEKENLYDEFKDKEKTIISGIIQRIEGRNIFVDLGKTVGLMFASETIPNEHYKIGGRYKFYVYAVEKGPRGVQIFLSRGHQDFLGKLFEMEVPEINEGIVEIKAIAREPGFRSKIAVHSNQPGIDAIGSCVGQRGIRVASVISELNNEKVDIIEWNEDAEKFVGNALAPAKVIEAEQMPKRTIKVMVPEEQLSLAIGKQGQNVRLAAKLTGWRIDIRSASRPEEAVEGGVAVGFEEEQRVEESTQIPPLPEETAK